MVDPAGTPAFSGTSSFIQLRNPGRLASLAGGRTLRVFVEDVGAGGSVVLRIAGKRFHAVTSLGLRKGEWYLARSHPSHGQIRLKVVQQVPRPVQIAELARSADLPADGISEAVVRAFLRSGLPLDSGRLTRAYRRLSSRLKDDPRRMRELARLDAITAKKGLEMDIETLTAILDPGHPSGGEHSSGDTRRRENDDDSGGEMSSDRVEQRVRGAFAMTDDPDHPLQLFNHTVGEGEHWVIIPIRVPGSMLEASLRLRIPRARALGIGGRPGGGGGDAARVETPSMEPDAGVLAVGDGVRQWRFALRLGPGERHVRIAGDEFPAGSGDAQRLRSVLNDLGYSLKLDEEAGDAHYDPGAEDGFSLAGSEDIMTSVDSSA